MVAWWLTGLDIPYYRFWSEKLPLALSAFFFLYLYQKVVRHPEMFVKRHGRKHALTGLVYLVWITVGFIDLGIPVLPHHNPATSWIYHVGLGSLGTVLTLYAAYEFKHKGVKNFASGTLDEHATVTYNEMIEHAFYQGLNLLQIVYFHLLPILQSFSFLSNSPILLLLSRLLCLYAVTLPWLWRGSFPVHSFSLNYKRVDEKSTDLIRLLYRIKKYQYVFYKHFLLHGLNLTAAFTGANLPQSRVFRLYWLLLNTSYVMEFFLQTLVKKRYMQQNEMLSLQQVLMAASTCVAVVVLQHASVVLSSLSLAMNFLHRGHDMANTLFVAGIGFFLYALLASS
eukprot:gene6909-7638_t